MRYLVLYITLSLFCLHTQAQDTASQHLNLHFQTTYIYQYKPSFSASYSGANSLSNTEEKQNSLTASLYLGIRLWHGAQFYINPEIAGGSGLSGAYGMGGSTNGETFRVGDPAPTLYLGRGFLMQTFALGNTYDTLTDQANQLAGAQPKDYLRFYIGKLSLGDMFDNNAYSGSPRTQYLNWALMNNGSWDYAANTRGYTYSFVTVLQMHNMAYKLALATLPKVANGPDLNTDLSQAYAINAEVDRSYTINNKAGVLRLLGYYNNANMGSYKQAFDNITVGNVPDVIATRKVGRDKYGFGINVEQHLSDNVGIWGRAGWNDGKNEIWCFAEIDATASLGLSLSGNMWKRKNDAAGIALVANGLSQDHRNYLANGGLGFQLGDGKLNYAYESIGELYYSYKPNGYGIWFTADYQFCLNPGYNSDRGPVNVFSFRAHVEL